MFEAFLKFFSTIFGHHRFKVAMVSYYYPYKQPSSSGVGIHAYNLVTHLAKAGAEVHVFASGEKKDSVERIRLGEGLIVIHFLASSSPFEASDPVVMKRVRYDIFETKVLREAVLEHSRRDFDVVHTHGWLTGSAFRLKYFYKLPWVHTVHSLERNRLNSMTEEEKKLFRITSWVEDTIVEADKLIAVSESVAKEVKKAFKGVGKKVEVIPNGVDLRLFKPASGKSPRTVLSVTRFSKEKGVEILPEVIKGILKRDNLGKFILVAPRTPLPDLQDVQKELDSIKEEYPKRFIWHDRSMMPTELAGIYREAGVYLQPSYYETFGLCVLEGMASGNAVVATDVGGIPEVVGKAGILTKPKALNLSRKVLGLFKNPAMRRKYRNLAIKRSKQFDWPIVAEQTFDLYKKVVEGE